MSYRRTDAHRALRAETIHLGLALLFCCGLRRGEVTRLRLAHYDPRERSLRIASARFQTGCSVK